MILADTIPLPDNIFWYSVATGVLLILFYVAKWWIGRVESRQDSSDMKFNTFLAELADMRQAQAIQNEVLERHSKYIESEDSNIKKMTNTMIEMLQFLTNASERDEGNPTVQKLRKGK